MCSKIVSDFSDTSTSVIRMSPALRHLNVCNKTVRSVVASRSGRGPGRGRSRGWDPEGGGGAGLRGRDFIKAARRFSFSGKKSRLCFISFPCGSSASFRFFLSSPFLFFLLVPYVYRVSLAGPLGHWRGPGGGLHTCYPVKDGILITEVRLSGVCQQHSWRACDAALPTPAPMRPSVNNSIRKQV